MIRRLSHTTIYVIDQSAALAFYTEKLGFEVRTDVTMEEGGFRWLTVGPKTQQDLELVLMPVQGGGLFDDAAADKLRSIIETSGLGAGVFETADCQATYADLKAKGVNFLSPPEERPYGIEAIFKDNSGNWFSLTRRQKGE